MQLGGAIAGGLSVNLDTWNSFPPEMQEVFTQIGGEYTDYVTNRLIGFMTHTVKTLRETEGVTVTELDRGQMQIWANAVPNIAGEWIQSTGPEAQNVLKFMMDEVRKGGSTPLRSWDLEFPNR